MPSPVVAYSRKITCPDCSPPSVAPARTISSNNSSSLRAQHANALACERCFQTKISHHWSRPPHLRPAARPLSVRGPQSGRTPSPSTIFPLRATNIERSASPSKATPKSAPAQHCLAQTVYMQCTAIEVNVAAVGLGTDRVDHRAGAPE